MPPSRSYISNLIQKPPGAGVVSSAVSGTPKKPSIAGLNIQPGPMNSINDKASSSAGNSAPAVAPTLTPTPPPPPSPTAPVTPGQTAPTPSVDPKLFATSANQEAFSLYEQTKGSDIDLRKSSRIINDLAVSLAGSAGNAPKPPSLMEMFTQQRQQLGLEPLESELANLDSEIERVQVGALVDSDRAGDRPVSQRSIDRRRGSITREGERDLAFLNVERSAVARQVGNKLATLQMVMDFTQQDFTNASQAYADAFNRNSQMLNLFMAVEDRELTAQDKLKQNATANLQTIWNATKDSGKSVAELPEHQRNAIYGMELQAGLPMGFFESLPLIAPDMNVLSTTTRESGGVKFADIIMRDPTTGAISSQSVRLGGVGEGGPSGAAAVTEYGSVISGASNLLPSERAKTARQGMTSAIASGDYVAAFAQVANAVEDSLTEAVKTKFANARTDYAILTNLQTAVQEFADAGGDTGFLKGTADQIARRFGQLKTDPKFAALAVQLEREFQSYRQNMTGAAFSPAESREYAAVNPRTSASIDLNLATITGALNQLENRVLSTIETRVPGASDLYGAATGAADNLSDDEAYEAYLQALNQ